MENKHHQYEREAVKLYRTANTAILSTLSKKYGDSTFYEMYSGYIDLPKKISDLNINFINLMLR